MRMSESGPRHFAKWTALLLSRALIYNLGASLLFAEHQSLLGLHDMRIELLKVKYWIAESLHPAQLAEGGLPGGPK